MINSCLFCGRTFEASSPAIVYCPEHALAPSSSGAPLHDAHADPTAVIRAGDPAHVFRSIGLVAFLRELEVFAGDATGGRWERSPTSGGAVIAGPSLDTDLQGWYGGNPIAESMGPADMAHMLATQPANVHALVERVRRIVDYLGANLPDDKVDDLRALLGPIEVRHLPGAAS